MTSSAADCESVTTASDVAIIPSRRRYARAREPVGDVVLGEEVRDEVVAGRDQPARSHGRKLIDELGQLERRIDVQHVDDCPATDENDRRRSPSPSSSSRSVRGNRSFHRKRSTRSPCGPAMRCRTTSVTKRAMPRSLFPMLCTACRSKAIIAVFSPSRTSRRRRAWPPRPRRSSRPTSRSNSAMRASTCSEIRANPRQHSGVMDRLFDEIGLEVGETPGAIRSAHERRLPGPRPSPSRSAG